MKISAKPFPKLPDPPVVRVVMTRYHGPTNTRGSRISARTAGGDSRVSIPWDYAVGVVENHVTAARRLADQLGWARPGTAPSGISAVKGGGYLVIFG